MFEFVVISKNNMLKIVSHLTKTETSLVIWLNIVTVVAQNVPHTCAKTSMPLVNCVGNDGLVSAMPNMQKTLLKFTTLV